VIKNEIILAKMIVSLCIHQCHSFWDMIPSSIIERLHELMCDFGCPILLNGMYEEFIETSCIYEQIVKGNFQTHSFYLAFHSQIVVLY
jgi:hypothetical protein